MEYVRLSVIGSVRRADLVLPDDEPIENLMPEILELLDEPRQGTRPVVLTRVTGEQLSNDATLGELSIGAATRLRVTSIDEAPPPPDIVEVTEAIAEVAEERADVWSPVHAAIVSAVTVLALSFAVTSTVTATYQPHLGWLLGAVAALAGLGVVAARRGRHVVAIALTASTAGAAPSTASAIVGEGTPLAHLAVPGIALVAGLIAVIAFLGFQHRGLALSGLVTAGTLVAVAASYAADVSYATIASVTGIAAIAFIGLLPGIALSLSGLTKVDDRVVEGERASRADVSAAINAAFDMLTATTVVAATIAGASIIALGRADNVWTISLGAALVVVLLLRSRMLPLGPQRLAVLIAAALAIAAWLATSPVLTETERIIYGSAAAAVVVLITALTPGAHTKARLRRNATTIEVIMIVSIIPLLLGQLGVYSDLLETFR